MWCRRERSACEFVNSCADHSWKVALSAAYLKFLWNCRLRDFTGTGSKIAIGAEPGLPSNGVDRLTKKNRSVEVWMGAHNERGAPTARYGWEL
jgi:hypothetical protein